MSEGTVVEVIITHFATFSLVMKTSQIEGFVPKNAQKCSRVVGKITTKHQLFVGKNAER